jgi:hypothetical protein
VTFARQYTDQQRQAIYELKREGLSGPQTARACAAGTKGLEPFAPTPETCNRIAQEEAANRDDLALSPIAREPDHTEAFRKLVRETMSVAERQVQQLRRDVARAKPSDRVPNAKATDALANALVKLHRLIEAVPSKPEANGKQPEQPAGFLEQLAARS